jgi:hypothetical protein
MISRLKKRFGTGLVLAAGFALVVGSSSPAAAAALTSTDLGTIGGLLDVLVDSSTGDILTPPSYIFGVQDFGDLENEVYQDNETGIYTYLHTVTPQDPGISPPDVDNIARFVTAYTPLGYDSSMHLAGWDYTDALGAGGAGDGTDFVLFETVHGRLAWLTDPESGTPGLNEAWDAGEAITVFFQSTLPPTEVGNYNMNIENLGTGQDAVATGLSFAPGVIPEPSTFFLLGSAMVVLGLVIRRRRS